MTASPHNEKTTTYLIRSLEDLDGLKDAWEPLSASARFPMQDFSWVRACAASLLARHELHVVVVADTSGPIAIAPLVKPLKGPVRLELLGVGELSEPMDFVYASDAALSALAGAVARSRMPLDLKRIAADSPTVGALERAFRGKGPLIIRPGNPYPRIPLDAGWTNPEQRLSSSRRSLLRRVRRRAEQLGTLTWEVAAPTRSNLAPMLEEAFRVEAASWKGRDGSALAKSPVKRTFFEMYAASACEEGILRMCFLRIGGRTAAMQYAVEHKGGFWLFKIGYDEEFASCSPGSILIEETVRYAASRGVASYEFLGSVEEWTRMWTDDQCECVSLRSYPMGFNGAVALGSDAARFAAGRIQRIVRRKAARR
jgi:CelD/BcsL family acetyltransferase involved in cellulose biosynthesis